ncbi:hypothetical protein BJ741DRAFT_577143 [Chytriomyces cf. hyalinus JEL632]|nr:hypothetical protein BJ741DRAFT_577143 [Chytriomyces cf. hyalinus JEL632]
MPASPNVHPSNSLLMNRFPARGRSNSDSQNTRTASTLNTFDTDSVCDDKLDQLNPTQSAEADVASTSADPILSGTPFQESEYVASAGPVPSKMPQACVFVANLVSSKNEDELFQSVSAHFSKWGEISEIKLDRDVSNRPYAFVQFSKISDAKLALAQSQSSILDGRPIRVEPAKVIRTLRIKFSPSLDANILENELATFGHIEDFSVLRYRDTQESKGVAYVKYFSRADAIQAFLAIRKRPKWAIEWVKNQDRQTELDKSSIFVGKLNEETVTEELLRVKFERYGEIERIQLFTPPNSRQAFAFIRYMNDNDAELAIDECHGSRWLDRIIKVQYREVNSATNHSRQNLLPPPQMSGSVFAPNNVNVASGGFILNQEAFSPLNHHHHQSHHQHQMSASFSNHLLNPAAEPFYFHHQDQHHHHHGFPVLVTPPPQYQPSWPHHYPPASASQHHQAFFTMPPPQENSYPAMGNSSFLSNLSNETGAGSGSGSHHFQAVSFVTRPGSAAGRYEYQIPPGWQVVVVPPESYQGGHN